MIKTKSIFFMISVFLTLYSCGKDDERMKVQTSLSKIINGSPVSEFVFSNVVELKMTNIDGSGKCTGTIIHPYLILTAAHCVKNYSNEAITVFYKGPDKKIDELIVQKVIARTSDEKDPKKVNYYQDDIAVLIMNEKININYNDILPLLTHTDSLEHPTVVFGFGKDKNNKPVEKKHYKNIKIKKIEKCQYATNHIRIEESANKGDSGGPLFISIPDKGLKQLGVISFRVLREKACVGASIVDLRAQLKWLKDEFGYDLLKSIDQISETIEKKHLPTYKTLEKELLKKKNSPKPTS